MTSVRSFDEDGVAILRDAVPLELVARVRDEIDELLPPGPMRRGRVENAWRRRTAIRELAMAPPVIALLRDLYGRRPIPFQTLDFAVGTEQRLHRDSVHFDSIPHGLMCGVWVAMEDIGPDDGPVVYVPGSHRDAAPPQVVGGDYARYEDDVDASLGGRVAQPFLARAGDAIVWAADLLHGGARVADASSTRRSQVTHYFFEGATYVTPMHGHPERGTVRLRDPLLDISTGRRVRHEIGGEPARVVHVAGGQSRLLAPGEPAPGVVAAVASSARAGR